LRYLAVAAGGAFPGNSQFITGINIGTNTVADGRGPQIGPIVGTTATVAMAMPQTYMITWWSNSTTITAAVWAGAGGNLNFAGNTLNVNGVSGVDCSAGSVNPATMVVTKGLVTHCWEHVHIRPRGTGKHPQPPVRCWRHGSSARIIRCFMDTVRFGDGDVRRDPWPPMET
jgi:hypothetical protein